jgi:hypothetical protein
VNDSFVNSSKNKSVIISLILSILTKSTRAVAVMSSKSGLLNKLVCICHLRWSLNPLSTV